MSQLTGGCLCGKVRFTIDEPFLGAMFCHCTRCQRRTGSAFGVGAATVPGSFHITAGETLITTYDPGDGGHLKSFCRECGGHTHSSSPEDPARISVRLGAIDGDPGIRPSAHQFTRYAATWLPIPDDGLPRFEERLPSHTRPTR